MFKYFFLPCFILALCVGSSFAQKREVAITIDDLPFVGEGINAHLDMIIDALKRNEIPATGFVIAGNINAKNWPLLHKFHDAGLSLGNHTLTHANLNRVATDTYLQEIESADKILMPVMSSPKFFRYPYLAMSKGLKGTRVRHFLSEKKYQIAPITIDSRDFVFNQLLLSVPERARHTFLEALKPCYLDYIRQQTLKAEERSRLAKNPDQVQILLVHANVLNAYLLPDILSQYKENGYTFVSLENALNRPAEPARAPERPKSVEPPGLETDAFLAWD